MLVYNNNKNFVKNFFFLIHPISHLSVHFCPVSLTQFKNKLEGQTPTFLDYYLFKVTRFRHEIKEEVTYIHPPIYS